MKNVLRISFISFILVLVNIVNVYAANITADIVITADKTDVKVGEIVTINLSANCETGIEGIDSTLEYDNTKLELQNVNVDTKFSDMSGIDEVTGEYKLTVISNSTDTLTQANFATITFKVLETVTEGEELLVKLSKIEIGDSNDEWTTIEDRQLTLKVEETGEEDNSNLGGDNDNQGNNNQDEDNGENEGNNNQDVDKDESQGNNNSGESNNPEENNNDHATNTGKEDNTQADKEFDKAGLKNYTFILILAIFVVIIITYKKYKQNI